jgi:hypothetical protein
MENGKDSGQHNGGVVIRSHDARDLPQGYICAW